MNIACVCGTWDRHSVTAAHVDLCIDNNSTWMDAFQFGKTDDLTWTLDGQSFELDVQYSPYDLTPLLHLSTGSGTILVDDSVQRVIHFKMDAALIQASLAPGIYVYDLVMVDVSGVRVALMFGTLEVKQGVTYPP
jgi:hypothetical protein